MSVATQSPPRIVPPSALPLVSARPAHWLNIARAIYRFFSHPLIFTLAWFGVFLLAVLGFYGCLSVVTF